jgi:hypothetical protein
VLWGLITGRIVAGIDRMEGNSSDLLTMAGRLASAACLLASKRGLHPDAAYEALIAAIKDDLT